MIAGYGCRYQHPLMTALGRFHQKPVGCVLPYEPHQIAAANVIPTEVPLTVHRLGQTEAQFLPAADLGGELHIICLTFRVTIRITLITQFDSIHVMNR